MGVSLIFQFMNSRNKSKNDGKRTSLTNDFFDFDGKRGVKAPTGKGDKRVKSNKRLYIDSYYASSEDDI